MRGAQMCVNAHLLCEPLWRPEVSYSTLAWFELVADIRDSIAARGECSRLTDDQKM